jgi:intracellular multiplication protein IcmL
MSSEIKSSEDKARQDRRAKRTQSKDQQSKDPKDPTRRARAERVVVRNLAVTSIHRRLLGMVVLATLLALVVCSIAFSVVTRKVPPQFIPVTEDGRLLPQPPLSKPNIDQAGISAFALEALHALNTYDYVNWRDQLNAAQAYFTPKGWGDYAAELQRVGTMRAVEERQHIVSMRPNGPVAVLREGVDTDGSYFWDVEVPLVISYKAHLDAQGSGSGSNRQEGVARLHIVRVKTTQIPRGIAIGVYGFRLNP